MLKDYNSYLIDGNELYLQLKENGFDIEPEIIDNIPLFGAQRNRQGLLINGEIPQVFYYSYHAAVAFLKDLIEFDLPTKLKARGIVLEKSWINHIPWQFVDGKYGYDIDVVVAYLNNPNRFNLQALLKDRGYDVPDNKVKEVLDIMHDYSDYHESKTFFWNFEKAITYITETTNYNIDERLQERGYKLDEQFLSILKYQFPLISHINKVQVYNLDKVIRFIEKNMPKPKQSNMYRLHETEKLYIDDKSINMYGNTPQNLYPQAQPTYGRFPIMKWYADIYHTIPDICNLGQIYIDELLEETELTIRWVAKNFIKYFTDDDYTSSCNKLRVIERHGKREYLSEALIEVEDGMFILLYDGRYKDENGTFYASASLFYKEGIHDPSEILEYIAEKEVIHYDTGSLGLLYHSNNGFSTNEFTIPNPIVDFKLNYNPGFEQIHDTILEALEEEEGKGLVLLHGRPGTGKTTYIRYLINKLSKNKIFVPPNLTELLSDPGFIPFLMDNTDCVLFIEDAENVLRSREDGNNNQAVSNILNITDGLLSDCLNIQIVATFNTHIKNIDPALLRKGRLIAQYEFTELIPERAEKLANSLKVWLDETDNLSLADIYAAKTKQEEMHVN